jgi:hypothetical protein
MDSSLPSSCFGNGGGERLRSAGIPALPADHACSLSGGVDVEVNEEIEISFSEGKLLDRLVRLRDVGVKQAASPDRSSVPDARRWRTTDDAHELNPLATAALIGRT